MNNFINKNTINKKSKVIFALMNIRKFWNIIKNEKKYKQFDREEKEWLSNHDNYRIHIESIDKEKAYLKKLEIETNKQFAIDIKENQILHNIYYEHLEDMNKIWHWQV